MSILERRARVNYIQGAGAAQIEQIRSGRDRLGTYTATGARLELQQAEATRDQRA